jgi:hypothetical protein
MKTHYKVERMVPDYENEAVFGGPSLKREFVNLCGSNAWDRTSNINFVTCKACINKMLIKPSGAKQ